MLTSSPRDSLEQDVRLSHVLYMHLFSSVSSMHIYAYDPRTVVSFHGI